jgi:uncharacterized membrane protein
LGVPSGPGMGRFDGSLESSGKRDVTGGRGHLPYGEVVEPTSSVRRFCFTYGPWIVAAAFSISGVVHLVRPATFTGIVPHFLPFSTSLVYASGVAELTCAIGLWRRQRRAGYAAVILLLAVWPANLQDAITTQEGHDVIVQVVTWLRVPLQIPLIWLALQSGRTETVGAPFRHS